MWAAADVLDVVVKGTFAQQTHATTLAVTSTEKDIQSTVLIKTNFPTFERIFKEQSCKMKRTLFEVVLRGKELSYSVRDLLRTATGTVGL